MLCGIFAEIREQACGSRRASLLKETNVADSPENPGFPGSPQPPSGPSVPPFQPVAPAYQPIPTPGFAGAGAPLPPASAPSGGSSALKIILIIVGILVFLVVMAVGVVGYIGYRVAHSMHVDKNGAVSITTPGGVITSNSDIKFTPDELGTDIYPGAVAAKSGNLRMNLPTGSMVSATYLTPDSKDKVMDFYKTRFGSQATSMDFGGTSILSMKKSDHDVISITLTDRNGKTQIQISHTTQK